MRVLIFSRTFSRNIYHPKTNSAKYYHKRTQIFMQSTHYSCQIITKLNFLKTF